MLQNFTKESSLIMELSAEGNLISDGDGVHLGDASIELNISHLNNDRKGASGMENEEVKMPKFKIKHLTHNYAHDQQPDLQPANNPQ